MNNKRKQGMKRSLTPMVLVVLAGLSSCRPLYEYRRPAVQVPEKYPGPERAGKELAAVPYRELFADPDLLELIDSAVANNHDLLIALKNIEYAGKTLDVAKLWYLPEAGLSATVNDSRASENSSTAAKGLDRNSRNFTGALSVSWEIDLWNKMRNAKRAAYAGYLRSTRAARSVQTTLVFSVAQGYWNLRMLDRQIDITRSNIALAETTLAMMRLQYDAGNVTSLAVQQQESQLLSARQALPRLEASRTAQENALSILAGRMPGTPIKRSSIGTTFVMPGSFSAGVPLELLRNRPDVREAEASLMEAHALAEMNEAMMYPSLTITAEGGLNSIEPGTFLTPGSIFTFFQASLLQPVFQHGRLKAQYEQSEIRKEQAELTFRKTLLTAVGEVSNALEQVDKTEKEETFAYERAGALRKAADNSRLLFQSGMATYLEVITTDSSLLQSELDLADVQRRRLSALADLYRAVGGGWRKTAADTSSGRQKEKKAVQ